MARPHLPIGAPEGPRASTSVPCVRLDGDAASSALDRVVVEEPLEMRVNGVPVAVTMRTPGHDDELAVGFVLTEGVVGSRDEVARVVSVVDERGRSLPNVVDVQLRPGAAADVERGRRAFYAASSCGICGKLTLDAIRARAPALALSGAPTFGPAFLRALPAAMRAAQATWDATGGLHAAALFDPDGALVVLREDVGRHNATDAVIGHALLRGRPLGAVALMVSGRAGFEIIQKAAVAGIPLVAAVSAPTSLAIDVAREQGVTLVAFLRPPKATLYTHPSRVVG